MKGDENDINNINNDIKAELINNEKKQEEEDDDKKIHKIEKIDVEDKNKKDIKNNDKENNKDEKNIKCPKNLNVIVLIFELFAMIPSGFVIYFTCKIYYDGEIARAISKDLFDNLNTGFFGNFSNCNSNNKMNSLFDINNNESNEIPLSFGEWQGTVKACKNINNKVHILDPGKSCGEDEKLIDGIPAQKLHRYKGLRLCALNEDSLSYYDLLKIEGAIIKQFDKCPEKKKSCGYVDTLKNKLCIDEKDNCPINYIRVSKEGPIEPINDLKVINSSKIKFFYSNNPYKNSSKIPYIVNSFKIADSSICVLPNLFYSEIILNDLEASKKNYSSNCVLKDFSQRQTVDLMRYHKLDYIDNYELYEENGIVDKIKRKELDQLGFDLERYKNHSLYLYLRSHYGFNYTCLKKREEKSEHNALEELQIFHSRGDKMKVWAELVFYLNFVPMVFSLSNVYTLLDKKEFWIKQVLICGTSLANFIYTEDKLDLDDAYEDKMECSDIVTNDEYNVMNEKLRNSGKNINNANIAIIFQLVSSLLILLYQAIVYFMGPENCQKKFNCCGGKNDKK